MNRKLISLHLREAAEELNRTVADVDGEAAYDVEDFRVAMGHLYHHLNTAWNGRDLTDEAFKKCKDADFLRFRRFPAEPEVYLD